MKIVMAIDSFKGSLSSMDAGRAAAEGIQRVDPKVQVKVRPLADGGEGTVEALTEGMGGRFCKVSVMGPFGEPVDCEYGILDETKTAIVEMSGAAGITLVPRERLNPLEATTYGVGEVIKDAIGQGCRRFIVGIGGSATNDGGVGMLQALGYDFLDEDGEQIGKGAAALEKLRKISTEHVLPELAECEFHIACDVTNPLCGERGCSAVFGPQKGATPQMIEKMDQWLGEYAKMTQEVFPKADAQYLGTGAAGGLGFAFLAYTPAVLESGIEIVLKELKLEEDIKEAIGIILRTGRGERVMRPEFGANTMDYAFMPLSSSTANAIAHELRLVLLEQEPRIRDVEIRCEDLNQRNGSVVIYVSYTVRSTNNRYNHVYPFYQTEGSEGGGAE